MVKKKIKKTQNPDISYSSDEEMKKVIGFTNFSSTKNKNHTPTNIEYVSQTKLTRKYSMFLNKKKPSRFKKEIL